MASYYVNRNSQWNGDHEVHRYSCTFLPAPENRKYLGEYDSCPPAVREARKAYPRSNGCYFCSPSCHTS